MTVVGITGHRVLSPAIEEYTTAEALRLLRRHASGSLVGVSCLAEGADSTFAELVLGLGGQLVVVVPAQNYREFLPPEHRPEYDRLRAAAIRVRTLEHPEADLEALMAASRVMVDEVDELIAIWDGRPSRGYAGTGDVVAYARSTKTPVHVVWPEGAVRD
ncbi:hypothetical protein UG55_102454 [Frankia sp. EI5c]|uniref:hypothetical protein n=1 Tax=Frankia sp. EI5c TaxID=683316 RepID=UPI0007C385A5|nr:hypothetical protein [Frankia sp. EI5c]OAA25233.1 hypothetical protein UG55_102454 [Frankia sp. EI5c]